MKNLDFEIWQSDYWDHILKIKMEGLLYLQTYGIGGPNWIWNNWKKN